MSRRGGIDGGGGGSRVFATGGWINLVRDRTRSSAGIAIE
jgi:hypothetical protein